MLKVEIAVPKEKIQKQSGSNSSSSGPALSCPPAAAATPNRLNLSPLLPSTDGRFNAQNYGGGGPMRRGRG
jgi:hypothetical protein